MEVSVIMVGFVVGATIGWGLGIGYGMLYFLLRVDTILAPTRDD